MRYSRVVLYLFCVLCIAPIQADVGRDAYDSGDYANAIEYYEKRIATGEHHVAIYFNLGQAYSQLGQWGNALVNYHRAQRLAPRDNEIAQRIATIRAIRPDLYVGEQGLLEQVASISTFFSIAELEALALILWSGGWIGFIIFWHKISWRARLRYPFAIASVIIGFVLTITFCRIYIETARPLAVVIIPTASVMSGAGDEYFAMFTLSDGAEGRILEQHRQWIKIELTDGRLGWIDRQAIVQI